MKLRKCQSWNLMREVRVLSRPRFLHVTMHTRRYDKRLKTAENVR